MTLQELVESPDETFLPTDNVAEIRRIAGTETGLHLERKEALLPYLEDGSVEADPITAPTQIGAE